MATTTLYRTPGGAGNERTWTFSSWIKRGELGTHQSIFSQGVSGDYISFRWNTNDYLSLAHWNGSSWDIDMETTRRFRDPGAWYHIVVTMDTTESVAADRAKIYINGIQETDITLGTYPSLNLDTNMNSTTQFNLGYLGATSQYYFNGVMAHAHLTDGTAYAASSFGEFDATSGIWVAKTGPSVTYGTNGFFLKFASGALGTDSSGNANTMTVGGTMTTTKDTPDNNFCTSTPVVGNADSATNLTLSNGNLTTTVIGSGQTNWGYPSSMGVTKGKWYMEYEMGSTAANVRLGIISDTGMSIGGTTPTANRTMRAPGLTTATYGLSWAYSAANGQYYTNDSGTAYGDSFTTAGDIIGCAFDADTGKLYFSKNGTWQNSGDPAAGTNPMVTITMDGGSYYFLSAGYSNDNWDVNYGNGYFGTTLITSPEADDAGEGAFKYDVPAGFYALCTNNIATYG